MKKVMKIGVSVFVIVILTFVIIYNYINNSSVKVVNEEIEIDNLPKEFEGFTILQLTDLHGKRFGDKQEELLKLINGLDFDIVAVTGDMQNRQDEDYEPFIDLIKGINNKEIFYTPGNHGPMVYTDEDTFNSFTRSTMSGNNNSKGLLDKNNNNDNSVNKENTSNDIKSNDDKKIRNDKNKDNIDKSNDLSDSSNNQKNNKELTKAGLEMKNLGVKFLDEAYQIKRGDKTLWVSELVYANEFKELTDDKYKDSDIKLALTHYPMSEWVYEGDVGKKLGKYDLILAGHYHGGQWRVPFIGALFIPDLNESGILPSQDRVSGLTTWGGFKQYVSRGIGAGGPIKLMRFRLFDKPEINIIKLVKK